VYKISYTVDFKRAFDKLHTIEKNAFARKVKILSENPFHPSLRTHKVRGHKNLFEFSVNMDIRVIWKYEGSKIILLNEIGHHDILKKY